MAGARFILAGLALLVACLCVLSETRRLSSFQLPDAKGKLKSLDDVTKKPVVLFVNVASQCGYTRSNYIQLQNLYEKYADQGLEIIAVPCNQFGEQEPGTYPEIKKFAKDNFHVTFPIMGKTDVNGPEEPELYTWLKKETKKDILWNFTKFLVVNGKPRQGYAHDIEPASMEKDIVKALKEANKEL